MFINPAGALIYAGGIDSIASSGVNDIKTPVSFVRQSLAKVFAGRPVSMPNTRAYDCSVKYQGA